MALQITFIGLVRKFIKKYLRYDLYSLDDAVSYTLSKMWLNTDPCMRKYMITNTPPPRTAKHDYSRFKTMCYFGRLEFLMYENKACPYEVRKQLAAQYEWDQDNIPDISDRAVINEGEPMFTKEELAEILKDIT